MSLLYIPIKTIDCSKTRMLKQLFFSLFHLFLSISVSQKTCIQIRTIGIPVFYKRYLRKISGSIIFIFRTFICQRKRFADCIPHCNVFDKFLCPKYNCILFNCICESNYHIDTFASKKIYKATFASRITARQ